MRNPLRWASLFMTGIFLSPSCTTSPSAGNNSAIHLEKFEPAGKKILLFIGQELEAIGGTVAYTDGYFDHFMPAAGFTQYTDFHSPGLQGLTSFADWGDGPENMSVTCSAPGLQYSCLAIGLDLSNGDDSVTATGGHDNLIYQLGKWIAALGDRPVFLRIGYEFNGHEWNHYQPAYYIAAWKRIKHTFDSMNVTNVAYV